MMAGINVRRVTGLVLLLCCFTLTSFAQSGNADVAAIISSLRARQYATALQVLAPAIERNPNDPQLRSLQGIAFAGQGHSPEALAAFHALSPFPQIIFPRWKVRLKTRAPPVSRR
jgi:hypothetical protein